MKKLILLALVCTGFAVTTPFTAQALDSEKIAQYVGVGKASALAEASPLENRDQNRNDRNRNDQDRDNQDRDNEGRATQSCDSRSERLRQRLFIVYYPNYDDSLSERLLLRQRLCQRQRKWIYESKHCNRRDARQAANRLERRGYQTQTL